MENERSHKVDELVNLIDVWYKAVLRQEIKKLKEKEDETDNRNHRDD